MTFEELLDQAIDLLQRRGRVTYRTLKRQFQLDDDVRCALTRIPYPYVAYSLKRWALASRQELSADPC
jgi:hypothetical protein